MTRPAAPRPTPPPEDALAYFTRRVQPPAPTAPQRPLDQMFAYYDA